MRKVLYIILSSVVVIIVGFVIYNSIRKKGDDQEASFKTAVVKRGDIVVKVTESGEVEPVTTVNIKSELAGEIKKLFVEEGDSVRAGDRLALVQQESSQAKQVAQAKASLERAKLNLQDAERNLNRKRELYRKGFIAKKDVEDVEKQYKGSKIDYELAQKQLWLLLGGTQSIKAQSLATKALDNIIVKSPIPGVVINLNVEESEMITSGTQAFGGGGTIIMTIADLSKLIVKVDINEVDVNKVRVGQPVNIGFDAIKGRVFRGRVKKVSPAGTVKQNIVVYPVEVEILGPTPTGSQTTVGGQRPSPKRLFAQLTEEQRATIRKEVQSLRAQGASPVAIRKKMQKLGVKPPKNRPQPPPLLGRPGKGGPMDMSLIKPGMTADLDIIVAQAKNVFYLPKEVIIKKQGETEVMLIKAGKPAPQPITTGIADEVNIEVKEGLKEGDRVAIFAAGQQLEESNAPERGGRSPRPR